VRVNARTLETIGNETFGGKLPRNVSAHSKVDPRTGEFVFFDYSLYEPWMTFGTVSPTNELVHFEKVELPGPRLPHDMGLTKNYIVLHDLPVVFTKAACVTACGRSKWPISRRASALCRAAAVAMRSSGSRRIVATSTTSSTRGRKATRSS
jgi:carotenoid cleavage dioxygenase-like enzyme